MSGKRRTSLMAAGLAAALASGCLGSSREDVPAPVAGAWTAEISATAEDGANGFATISVLGPGQTRVNATLTDVAPNTEYLWSLWTGGCGEDGERVGAPELYPAMRSGDRGTASATATLPEELPGEEAHRLEVYAPDGSTVVGCGNLQ